MDIFNALCYLLQFLVKREGIKVEIKQEPIHKRVPKTTVNEISERDERLFFKAVQHNELTSLLDYLGRGIDINLKDSYGWTPLVGDNV